MSNTFTPYNSSNPTGYIPGLEKLSIQTPNADNSNVLKPVPLGTQVIQTTTKDSGFIAKVYQPLLVPGENIKTINGSSVLGAGNIEIIGLSGYSGYSGFSGLGGLPLTGGTMTGAITSLRETKVAMSANNINLATGNVFTKTITVGATLTISNVAANGNVNRFILELTNGGAYTVTWFSGAKWVGGIAPTLTTSGKDIIGFYSHDGGTTWNGTVNKDVK